MAIAIRSVSDPFVSVDPDVTRAALETIVLADAMGLLPTGETVECLDLHALRRVAAAVTDAGIGTAPLVALTAGRLDERRLRETIETLHEALEESPAPAWEWGALVAVLQAERLAALVAVSPASLRRYAAATRPTPDDVAERLHFLAKVVGDLKGAYNDAGIRRWFERKRPQLDGRSPAQVLRRNWHPDDAGPVRVRALARSLVFSPAT